MSLARDPIRNIEKGRRKSGGTGEGDDKNDKYKKNIRRTTGQMGVFQGKIF